MIEGQGWEGDCWALFDLKGCPLGMKFGGVLFFKLPDQDGAIDSPETR